MVSISCCYAFFLRFFGGFLLKRIGKVNVLTQESCDLHVCMRSILINRESGKEI